MLATKSAIQIALEGLSGPPRQPSRKKERAKLKRDLKEKVPVKAAERKVSSGKQVPKRRQEVKMSHRKQMKRAVCLHGKTLEDLFSSDQWTARESGIMKAVNDLETEIASLKDKLDSSKVRRIRDNSKPKSTSTKAVMNLKSRHHSTKVYISPEQRAINKAKDGARTMNLSKTSKATRLLVEVGSSQAKYVGPVRNAKPGSRKLRLKKEFLDRQLIKEFARLQSRSTMEVVSVAA